MLAMNTVRPLRCPTARSPWGTSVAELLSSKTTTGSSPIAATCSREHPVRPCAIGTPAAGSPSAGQRRKTTPPMVSSSGEKIASGASADATRSPDSVNNPSGVTTHSSGRSEPSSRPFAEVDDRGDAEPSVVSGTAVVVASAGPRRVKPSDRVQDAAVSRHRLANTAAKAEALEQMGNRSAAPLSAILGQSVVKQRHDALGSLWHLIKEPPELAGVKSKHLHLGLRHHRRSPWPVVHQCHLSHHGSRRK